MSTKSDSRRRSRRLLGILVALATISFEAMLLRSRGYAPFGGRVRVRCSAGHEFETLWIPGVSLFSLRLGPKRLMRCRVGHHWSLVTLVAADEAGDAEPA